MKIKRIIFVSAVIFLALSLSSLSAYDGELENAEEYREIYEASGADELFENLDSETQSFLSEINSDKVSVKSLLDIDSGKVFSGIADLLKKQSKKPMAVFLSGLGVILLTALLGSMREGSESSADETFSLVSAVSLAAFSVEPVSSLISGTAEMLKTVGTFISAFIPVCSGLIMASGKPASSAIYPASLAVITEIMSAVSGNILVPTMRTYLAFCLIGSLALNMKISLLGEKLKSAAIFILGFALTIFTGLFTIKGLVSSSVDTVSLKGMKFLSSAFLPVVGGAISDAMNAVGGCLELIKSSVGGFSLIAVFSCFLPYILSALLYIIAYEALAFVAETMGAETVKNLLKSTLSVLSILLSVMAVFLVALIVMITITITVMK